MKKENYDVLGMTCAACQAHVNKAVSDLEGIKSCNVNLVLNNMAVEYDENKVNEETIIKAVRDAGYDAKKQVNEIKKDINEINKMEAKKLKTRLIVSIIFWIPLMIIAMHHMIPGLEFIHKYFGGAENALKFALVQLVLTVIIMIINNKYFRSGFKSLLKRCS